MNEELDPLAHPLTDIKLVIICSGGATKAVLLVSCFRIFCFVVVVVVVFALLF